MTQSVVTRLVLSLIVGGVLASVGFSALEFRRSQALLQLQLSQRISLTTRNIQGLLRGVSGSPLSEHLRDSLRIIASDPAIVAVRAAGPDMAPLTIGDWSMEGADAADVRLLPEYAMGFDGDISWDRLTLVRGPFLHDGQAGVIEVLVDGGAAWRQTRAAVHGGLRLHWVITGALMLLGLLLIRRWFTGPLSDVSTLVAAGAAPESFFNLARVLPGEFHQFAQAIGGMLARLESTARRLKQREQAFENLYQFAPAAMLSLHVNGTIVDANRRAAALLGADVEDELTGKPAGDFVLPQDLPLWRQALDRLDLDNAHRCELRLMVRSKPIDALVEFAGVRDEDGVLLRVRVSVLDITQSKRLQRALADKSRLLNLVIDHMSDAILLVDAQGRIAAHNQQLATLLHRRGDLILGGVYDAEHFWNDLGAVDHDLFISRLRQMEAQADRPAHHRVLSRVGTFLFQTVPVRDGDGALLGRLWVVQEITAQEQNERLLRQQNQQLEAIKRLGGELRDVHSVDDLLGRTADLLYDMIGVETIGVALRRDARDSRSQQVIHRGAAACLLAQNRALVEAVECHLMPRILASRDVAYWQELPPGEPWTPAFEQAGLTCLAGAPLRGSADGQGMLWIARRGGDRIERHHIYMLEALTPVIAARIEFAQQREHLHMLELTDPVTDLPNRRQLDLTLRQLAKRPGRAWSVVLVSIDHFHDLNGRIGHEAGDALLRRLAVALRGGVRRSCHVGRFGGRTFCLVCPDLHGERLEALAQRIRQLVGAVTVELPDGQTWTLSAAIGAAAYPDDGHDPASVVDLAADCLQQARALGRHQVVHASSRPRRAAG